ncbi:unnamed protein product [Fusarium langsethiae]|nr:unnamed protein product [Fusarium langsethiae]
MPEQHRPDWKAYQLEGQPRRSSKHGPKYKDWFMWPDINQEDLSQPKLMRLLLNSRGRNTPPIFAAAGWEAVHVGQISEGLNPPYLHGLTMVTNGATTSEEYGDIVRLTDEDPAAECGIYLGFQFWIGERLLILRAQVRITNFVIDLCCQILHKIPPDDLTSSAYSIQPEPSVKTGIDESGYPSKVIMAAEAPYKVPSDLDLDCLASLLKAQM